MGEHYICGVAVDRNPMDACAACTPDYVNDETSCVPYCPPHLRSAPRCFNVRVWTNGLPTFTLPAPGDRRQVIDMNFPFEITIKAGDANWMDPVTLAVYGVHPDGSSIIAVPDEMATYKFRWRPSRRFGGWSQVRASEDCADWVS